MEFDKALSLLGLKEDRDYERNKTWNTYTFSNGHYVKCVGANNPESSFVGGTYSFLWFDEIDKVSPQAYLLAKGRISAEPGIITYTSSPRGFNHVYEDWKDLYATTPRIIGEIDTPMGKRPGCEVFTLDDRMLIRATTYSNTDLSDSYLRGLERSYSDRLLEQEFYSARIALTSGKAYPCFDITLHASDKITRPDKKEQIYCFKDYNVFFDVGVLCYKRNGILYAFDEIKLEYKTHDDFAQALRAKVAGLDRHPQEVILIGDPAGNWKKSLESNKSAYSVFKGYGFRCINPGKSPEVTDRVLLVDSRFSNNQLMVHPRCSILINDLQKVMWKEGKNELDPGQGKKLTHMSDGFGYGVLYLMPYPTNKKKRSAYATNM